MKRCVLFFVLLLVTLFIAIWIERHEGPASIEGVALEESVSIRFSNADELRSE